MLARTQRRAQTNALNLDIAKSEGEDAESDDEQESRPAMEIHGWATYAVTRERRDHHRQQRQRERRAQQRLDGGALVEAGDQREQETLGCQRQREREQRQRDASTATSWQQGDQFAGSGSLVKSARASASSSSSSASPLDTSTAYLFVGDVRVHEAGSTCSAVTT